MRGERDGLILQYQNHPKASRLEYEGNGRIREGVCSYSTAANSNIQKADAVPIKEEVEAGAPKDRAAIIMIACRDRQARSPSHKR